MNYIRIQRLKFDTNIEIQFKQGVNYIQGLNASGKTTVFNLIQYLLGLRKDFGMFPLFNSERASLLVEVNGANVEFQRELDSQKISIISNSEVLSFNFNSAAYYSFLIELLKPQYDFEVSDNIIVSLIREAFVPSSNFDRSGSNYIQKEINLLKLGVNAIYVRKIKSYVKELGLDITNKEKAFNQLKAYKQDIDFLFTRELSISQNKIDDITNSTLQKYSTNLNEALMLFDQSKIFLDKLVINNENILQNKIGLLETNFKNYLKSIVTDERILMQEIVEGREMIFSYSKRSLIRLIYEITIQMNSDFTNGLGFLVNDSALLHLDISSKIGFRDIVKQICRDNSKFQYIEFTTDSQGIDRKDIIFDLGKGF